jgi:hypothetical protein
MDGLVMDTPAGGVCIDRAFQIPTHNPSMSMLAMFDPTNGNAFSYSYSVADLGESHDAQGTYTLTPHPDGSITVSASARDHVVFNGFDGTITTRYAFDLVPMDGTCP